MYLLSIFFSCIILYQTNVFAELSSSSCTLLRTANSLTTIVPEIAQLAMRFYRASSLISNQHHRQKRFLSNGNIGKSSHSGNVKGTVVEQIMANTFRDVNFTNVAILMLNNNETMNKLRQNIDNDAIIRIIMREINYEKLGKGLWSTFESKFNLEDFITNIINITQLDVIHHELLSNGTLPEWLLKNLNPNLNIQIIERIFLTLKNVTDKFVKVLSKSERYDNYLFNMITQQALTPLNNIIQEMKQDKPSTLDQLIEIIINNINRVTMEQFTTDRNQTKMKKSRKNLSTSTVPTVDLNNNEEVKIMLYQWSIAIDSIGQTVRVILKSLEQLYCTSVWE
ncbi:unnamed protein product [Adineta steineri]|uniref:Uncharacterized protein n=1 Tax=Adineta steineri TaxID=433720 RepID=A0A814TR69_9BILA|nr:unnamed protein product [Adineta steineri]CAF3960110.1 unnamed protein product [Adineta steineri]